MAKNNDVSVNKRIAAILEERNIKTKKFALMAGINPNTFRGYIDSYSSIPLDKLQKIAKTLGVSTSFLLGEKECSHEIEQMQDLLKELKNVTLKMSNILESD